MDRTPTDAVRHRLPALAIGAYLAAVGAFALARIGFRVIALVEGNSAVFSLAKTRTFVLFTGPARAVAMTTLLLPVLLRRHSLTTGHAGRVVAIGLAVLAVAYVIVQWDHEMAQAGRSLGVILLLVVVATYTAAFSALTPRIAARISRLGRPLDVVILVAVCGLGLLLALVGVLTTVFSDFAP